MAATTRPTHVSNRRGLGAAVLRVQPDRRLLRLSREGSVPAFEEIVRRYAAPLSAYAASIAAPDRAEDIVQDSFTRAYRHLGNGAGTDVEQLKPWLYRVVRNTALNDLRDEGRHEHDELDLNYDGVEQPPQAFERRAQIASLFAALQQLPKQQRDAIVKRELDGSGHEQIAADMGLSAGAVRQLIYRARRTLREGVGMLLPTPLVRYLLDSGGTELAGAGVAGAGIGGVTVFKSGAAAAVVAASLLAGSKLNDGFDPVATSPTIETGSRAAGAGGGLAAISAADRVARRGTGAAGASTRQTVNRGRDSGSSGSGQSHSSGGGAGSHSGSSDDSHSGSSGDGHSHSAPSGGGDSHSGSGGGGETHSGSSGGGSGSGKGSDDGVPDGSSDGSGSGVLPGSSGPGPIPSGSEPSDSGDPTGSSGPDGGIVPTDD